MKTSKYLEFLGPKKSSLELLLSLQIDDEGLPEPVREYQFDLTRRWRADFAWPEIKLLVECEGGTWKRSRHTSGKGFHSDCHKYNSAVLQGWRLLRFDSTMVNSGEAITIISMAINNS